MKKKAKEEPTSDLDPQFPLMKKKTIEWISEADTPTSFRFDLRLSMANCLVPHRTTDSSTMQVSSRTTDHGCALADRKIRHSHLERSW